MKIHIVVVVAVAENEQMVPLWSQIIRKFNTSILSPRCLEMGFRYYAKDAIGYQVF